VSVVSENLKKSDETKIGQVKDIEDVVSMGALLRPTLVSAVHDLKPEQLDDLNDILIDCEKSLSNSTVTLRTRLNQVAKKLEKTFVFAPIWRFISTRIEDVWAQNHEPSVRELSMVSLIIGMLIEEVQSIRSNSLQSSKSKKRKSA